MLDAMDSGDPRKFCEELGDLLLQVTFHAILAEKAGNFTISDIIRGVHTKMIRRHPHVFGNTDAKTPAAVLKNWERIKAQERAADAKNGPHNGVADKRSDKPDSLLAAVPRSLPAVLEAYQLGRRASRIGFDWDTLGRVIEKVDEEKRELLESLPPKALRKGKAEAASRKTEEEVGDLFFAMVNLARFLGVDTEIALKKANRKFKHRFQLMEKASSQEGLDLADAPRGRMEELWNLAKSQKSKSQPTT